MRQAMRLQAHAWLMVIGWGLLLPSGAVVAHSFKSLGPIWFRIHRTVQILGLSCALTGDAMLWLLRHTMGRPAFTPPLAG
jgi:hypothetical protein